MIFGNGLKKFDFARQNLDGRAKCLAQKTKKHCSLAKPNFLTVIAEKCNSI